MVNGFGTNYEPKDRKLIPGKLIAFRKFRFKPRPAFEFDSVGAEWNGFIAGVEPWSLMPPIRWQKMGYMLASYGKAYAEMYFGANEWKPCLTAAGYGNVVYGPGEHEAVCSSSFFHKKDEWDYHTAPKDDCTCGFWAYYTPDQIDTGCGNDWMATAAVEVWGDIVLGEKGVRAQKMKIVGLLVPREVVAADNIDIVQAWHKVVGELKVPQYWNRAEFLEFHPKQDVSELLPKRPPAPEYPYTHEFQSFSSTYNRWLNMQQFTKQFSVNGNPALYGTPVTAYTYTPYVPSVVEFCCVCKYRVEGRTQKDVDRMMAVHTITDHFKDATTTSTTNP
jgi:hypothetical protein